MSNGRSRLINIILVCSLAINLLLVGGFIGRMMMERPSRPVPNNLSWMFRVLDDETRQALRPEFERHVAEMRSMRQSMRHAQKNFEAQLVSKELDSDALRKSLDALRSTSEAYQKASHEQMIALLGKLDQEDRVRMMAYLQRRGRPGADDRPGAINRGNMDRERRRFDRPGDSREEPLRAEPFPEGPLREGPLRESPPREGPPFPD
jgi:uncharacterized membrane protein